jgi:hypothetical protein
MMQSLFPRAPGFLRTPLFSAPLCVLSVSALSFLLVASPAGAQDDLARRRAEYDRETNPVNKAKKLPRMGDAQFAAARQAVRREDYAAAAKLVEEYRDEVTRMLEALRAAVSNPERNPAGFKHLEIHVRRSLERLADLIAETPLNHRSPFETVRADLEKVNRQLLLDLFPQQPGGKGRRTPSRSQP